MKYLCIKEFVECGLLQEVNRCFFHPLGLAVEVLVDGETGEARSLNGIRDHRDDPEGLAFPADALCSEVVMRRAISVATLRESKRIPRYRLFQQLSNIQPVPGYAEPGAVRPMQGHMRDFSDLLSVYQVVRRTIMNCPFCRETKERCPHASHEELRSAILKIDGK